MAATLATTTTTVGLAMFGLAVFGLTSCSREPLTPTEQVALNVLPSALVLDPRAITLAVGGTQQLTPHAFAASGDSLGDAGTVTFASSDTTRVKVSPTGLISALAVTTSTVRITSAAQQHGVTLRDTAYVVVTATASPVTAMTLQPQGTDSARYGVLASKVLRGTFTTGTGVTQTPFVMLTAHSTAVRLAPASQSVTGLWPGAVWIYGSAMVYGTPFRDSVLMTFTDPVSVSLYLYTSGTQYVLTGANADSYLAVNGSVSFTNGTMGSVGVTFSDSTAFSGGNIQPLGYYESDSRQAIRPGRYTWTMNTVPALTGAIVVR